MIALQTTWFMLVGVLLVGYAILDGFDLGVGFWYLTTKKEEHRRTLLNSIGPVWDGNEVWLLTGGGALFAAFPPVYASVFSGFYLAMMLVLFGLIFRAVGLEFRNQVESPGWRKTWDVAFSVGSMLPALLFGVALGNIMRGIPLNAKGDFTGTFFTLLNPYALTIGLTGLAMLATHGALYAAVKTEDELQQQAGGWARMGVYAYTTLFVVSTVWSVVWQPHLFVNYARYFPLLIVPVIGLAAIGGIWYFLGRKEYWKAFLSSSLSIAAMMGTVGASLFPRLVPALGNPKLSLTAYNASSSQKTLTVMLVVALIGMPLVLFYTAYTYRVFKGKAKPDSMY